MFPVVFGIQVHGAHVIGIQQLDLGVALQGQLERFTDDVVVEAFELILRARQVNCCQYPARQGIAGVVDQVQRKTGVAQQLDVERGEHCPHPPWLMLKPLDQHGERLLTQVHLDLVQRALHPQHLDGHRHAVAAHRQCLGFQPFTVLLHIALPHDRQGLLTRPAVARPSR